MARPCFAGLRPSGGPRGAARTPTARPQVVPDDRGGGDGGPFARPASGFEGANLDAVLAGALGGAQGVVGDRQGVVGPAGAQGGGDRPDRTGDLEGGVDVVPTAGGDAGAEAL